MLHGSFFGSQYCLHLKHRVFNKIKKLFGFPPLWTYWWIFVVKSTALITVKAIKQAKKINKILTFLIHQRHNHTLKEINPGGFFFFFLSQLSLIFCLFLFFSVELDFKLQEDKLQPLMKRLCPPTDSHFPPLPYPQEAFTSTPKRKSKAESKKHARWKLWFLWEIQVPLQLTQDLNESLFGFYNLQDFINLVGTFSGDPWKHQGGRKRDRSVDGMDDSFSTKME